MWFMNISQKNHAREGNEWVLPGKEEAKLLFAEDMVTCIEDHQNINERHHQLITKFSSTVGYTINM